MGFFSSLKQRIFNQKDTEKVAKKLDQKNQKEVEKLVNQNNKVDSYIAGLSKSNSSFVEMIKTLENRHNKIDEDFFEELEEILIMSDISVKLVDIIINEIKKQVRNENITDPKLIKEVIADKLFTIYASNTLMDTTLNVKKGVLSVVLMVGVNGTGKTTSVAKIAHKYKNEGFKVLLVAADTFRAAAVEQLMVWAQRVGVDIVIPNEKETDPASVVYRACDEAIAKNYDLVLVDTAGRLQNKVNLMNELAKINKIISSKIENAPQETLLTIDATTGQNGLSQAKLFSEVTPLTGLILTKIDGTSKGGIVLTIKDELGINVKYIGLGEKIDDLKEFDLDNFIYALTKGMGDE